MSTIHSNASSHDAAGETDRSLQSVSPATFPPRDQWDVLAYDTGEVVAGYRDHRHDDPVPGANHSPGYRWGWLNARKDASRVPDGFDGIRSAVIRTMERPQ